MAGVDITWAGGEHSFALTIDLMRALQERCDAGPAWVLTRLRSGQWMVDDVVSTIRLGLEGGGLSKDAARKLVAQHVEDRPLAISVLTAQLILMSALYGTEDDPVGEASAGAATQTDSRADDGSSAASTEPEQP